MYDDVEVASGAALRSCFALACDAKTRARLDARGNLHLHLLLALDAPRAAASLARRPYHTACATALTARARDREEALLISDLPRACARGAVLGLRARSRARTRASLARFEPRYAKL